MIEAGAGLSPQDVDETVRQAAQEAAGGPIKVRVQPQVYLKGKGARGAFLAWRGVHWMITCTSVKEAQGLRKALTAFFAAVGRQGFVVVTKTLDSLPAGMAESATSDHFPPE